LSVASLTVHHRVVATDASLASSERGHRSDPDRTPARVATAAMIGTAIEWYDFFVYGTSAVLVLGPMFFPTEDPLTATLLAFSTVGIGFLVRPLGAVVLAHYGDRYGRKQALVASLLLMGAATFAVGLLPTYAQVGAAAPVMLVLRTMRAALLVPVLEELFWRGWLPRWLQDNRFWRVPLGTYTTFAFWGTALLFAAEHGPFWEVGLVCGVIYNWWMRRTGSLGDLILTHAVTNLALSVLTILTARWVFWM